MIDPLVRQTMALIVVLAVVVAISVVINDLSDRFVPPRRRAGMQLVVRSVMVVMIGLGLLACQARFARSETVPLGRWGAWSLHGGTTSTRVQTCGLIASLGGGRSVVVQFLADHPHLLMRAVMPGLGANADGADMQVSMGGQSWTARAAAPAGERRWTIGPDVQQSLTRAFATSREMALALPGSGLPAWRVQMDGGRAALGALMACVRSLGDLGGRSIPVWATQP